MKFRRLTFTAMIAALSAIGAMIKIPVGIGSAALDSAPAFLGAALLPAPIAGVAAAIGHMVSAELSGFPMTLPFHALIAIEMFAVVYGFAMLHQRNHHLLKWLFAVIANGILAPLPFYFLISSQTYYAITPGIFIATVINAVIAGLCLPAITKVTGKVGDTCR